jgi:hypothetical protein
MKANMRYLKLFALAYLLPFIVALNACQQNDKHTGNQQPTDRSINQESAPTTITDGEFKTDAPGSNPNEKLSDGKLKQVTYQQQTDNFNTQDKRMIIRSGTMQTEIDNFTESEAKVKQIVTNFNGYVTNSTSQLNASGKKQGTITIRVSSDKFDGMLDELGKIGKVVNQNISGKDVTEEYMDAEARLKTQRELESRLLQLLAEKTANLTAVVEVEQKLSSVRENIEKTEGRMRYLKDQSAYSTLTLSLYEPAILNTSSGGGFFYEIGQGVKRGLNGFTSVISGIITVVIALSPVLAILGLAIYITIRIIKKRKVAKA